MPIPNTVALADKLKKFYIENLASGVNDMLEASQGFPPTAIEAKAVKGAMKVPEAVEKIGPGLAIVMNAKNAAKISSALKGAIKAGYTKGELLKAYFEMKHPRLTRIASIKFPEWMLEGGTYEPVTKSIRINLPDVSNFSQLVRNLGHEITHAWQDLKPFSRVKEDPKLVDKVLKDVIESNKISTNPLDIDSVIASAGGVQNLKKALIENTFKTEHINPINYYPAYFSEWPKWFKNSDESAAVLRNITKSLYREQPIEKQAIRGGRTAEEVFNYWIRPDLLGLTDYMK